MMRKLGMGAGLVLSLLMLTDAASAQSSAQNGPVLNGKLALSDFDGGVGDRFGTSTDVILATSVYVPYRARAHAFARASAFASAHASSGHR